jgi:hypothetical protein
MHRNQTGVELGVAVVVVVVAVVMDVNLLNPFIIYMYMIYINSIY